MQDLTKLREDAFFNMYFWMRNTHSEYGNNRAGSSIAVCPFLHRSKNFYWEKAYVEYLGYLSEAASIAELQMDYVYTYCNAVNMAFYAVNIFFPLLKQLFVPILILGTAWNLIDTCGVFILAARDGKNHDGWSQGINILSGIQLLTGTIASVLLNTDIIYIGIPASLGLSAIATGASGFAFAAAMFFSWALEHREVKLHRARIDYLAIKIQELEATLFHKLNVGNYPGADKYKDAKDEREKITCLKMIIGSGAGECALKEYKYLLELLNFRQHQQLQLEIHERARRAWGLCAMFMMVVAIVSVTVIALGLSAVTCGIALATASCAALLGSALYRNKPEVCDNAAKTIKTHVHSFFFKPQPINHHQNAKLDSDIETSAFPSSSWTFRALAG